MSLVQEDRRIGIVVQEDREDRHGRQGRQNRQNRQTGLDDRQTGGGHMTVELDGFAAEAIGEEAARLGVPVDELVSFSVMYYLADIDSGRIARDAFGCTYPDRVAE